jgi:predicted amidophosphoribosyltransferase
MSLAVQQLVCGNERFEHYYLCNYRPVTSGIDELSKSILNFKNGRALDVDAWIECSILELGKIKVERDCLIVRVLGSEETINPKANTPLDQLGKKLASKLQAEYHSGLLTKSRETQKVKQLSGQQREVELSGVYQFVLPKLRSNMNEIFILDDVLTTGSTIRAVIRAIREVSTNCSIRIFTLAFTDNQALMNRSVHLESYPYSWEINQGWSMAEEDADYYSAFNALRSRILNDTF